jgi:hypothetical protein
MKPEKTANFCQSCRVVMQLCVVSMRYSDKDPASDEDPEDTGEDDIYVTGYR